MQKHEDNLATQVDGAGLVPMPGVTVTVIDQSTGLAAALYSDNGVTPITTPIVTDNTGYYGFFAADGRYTITFTNPRIVTFTRDVILEDPKDNPYATLAQLAAPTGSTNIGNGTETVADSLNALQLADYTALRAYAGPRKSVYVIASGIAGMFVRDDSDMTTADNGGTVIVAANGKRWKRRFTGGASIAWFGAKSDGSTDDTSAVQAAVNAMYAQGGGIVAVSAGVTCIAGTISCNFTSVAPVSIVGAGRYATTIKRIGLSTSALFAWSSPPAVLNNYSLFSDFSLLGNSNSHDGIAITNIARFAMERVRISGCANAINNAGSLVYLQKDCTIEGNLIGVYARAANGVSCNLVQIEGGQISANSVWGCDIGGGASWGFHKCDISANGTAGNTATGGVMVRSTVTAESGYAVISFDGVWFEANKGRTFTTEGAADLSLAFRDVTMLANEAGRCINVPQARHFVAENLIAPSPSDTVTVAATNSIIIGGTINTLADTSAHREYIGNSTASGVNGFISNLLYIDGPAGNNTIIGSDDQIGGGSANDLSIYHYGSGKVNLWAGGVKQIQFSGIGVGFNGTAPISKPTVSAAATDAATTQTLANSLRTALIALGLAT